MVSLIRLSVTLGAAALIAALSTPHAHAATEPDQQASAIHLSKAVVIEQPLPEFPRRIRRSQEAWVRMSYVVSPEGRAIDPIIIDSSGGIGFEEEVRKVSGDWRFEPGDQSSELPYNIIETRFIITGQGQGSTKKFARYAKHIMKNLNADKLESASGITDEALHVGGWSLYESTILYLMAGRVAGAEGNDAEKLEMYRRGLAVSDDFSLSTRARRDLLEDIFQLEVQLGQYAAALRTFETLEAVRGSAEIEQQLSAQLDEIRSALKHDPAIVAKATIANPCDCEEGVPLWEYAPIRRIFSFANVSGKVERFEARCEQRRIDGEVRTGQTWTLDEDWGSCRVFVFGDDNATFDFLGHLPDNGQNTDDPGKAVVARNHVLDQRSRSH